MKNVINVDWQITSVCNRSCPYCFGPQIVKSVSLADAIRIVDRLKKLGTRQIGITGGEPLLYPYFSEIVKYITNSGMTIYLSTNCDYYDKFSNFIKSHISILGIPIDGVNPDTHNFHRGSSSFSAVMNVLNDIQKSNCPIKIKIGTVVTKYNCKELRAIESFLAPFKDKIIYWKLYQLISYKRNEKNVLSLMPESVDLRDVGYIIGKEKIVDDTLEKRNRSYFFIKPNGDLFVPFISNKLSEEKVFGNILTDDESEIVRIFNDLVNEEGYYNPYRYMRI